MDGTHTFAARMLTLQVLPAGSERYFDGSRPITIGRDATADVVVLDTAASRQHAVLRADPGGAWVFEDQSSNGTYLDGSRVARMTVDRPMTLTLGTSNGAARLRLVPRSERSARVDAVMRELGLEHRAGMRVEKLSGGQRKRTSVAIELLTRPSLLILDEPTSGLDPGYEKSVMELLRELADGGRTVLTVTHSIQRLDLCDRLLFLAPGGQTAYFGPPSDALSFFAQPGYPEVFQHLDRAAPSTVREAFAGTAIERRYVTEPLEAQRGR